MHIVNIEPEPLLTLRYLNAARRGGTEVRRLSVEKAWVDGLPEGLTALICAADLQGVVPDPTTGVSSLLGVALVHALEGLALEGELPSLDSTAALLAGDLFSVPDASKRGGFGDVKPVWLEFARAFRWVAGVAGNHDDVTGVKNIAGAHLLDLDPVVLDGLKLCGVGLIAGDPAKPGRRTEEEQLERIALACSERPDVLLLHEGPDCGSGRQGNPRIFEVLADAPPALTVCGHDPWREPWAAGPRVLNVCERVMVLVRR